METRHSYAYSEEAFAYLLRVQRKRSERADRPFQLLLIELRGEPGQRNRIDPQVSRLLFSSLWRVLRENDIIGWYSTSYIAGVVLTECKGSTAEASDVVVQRITSALGATLPPSVAERLQIRVCQIQPRLSS